MNPITYQDKIKFEALKKIILNFLEANNYNTFNITYETFCDLVKSAKRLNKVNNQLLKHQDFDSVVYNFYAKDIDTDKANWNIVHANKRNTVKLLFIYEFLSSQYATKQCFLHFKNI